MQILPKDPRGVVLGVGAAGSGDTSHILEIVLMNLDNDCVPVVASTTNDALNNGCDRF